VPLAPIPLVDEPGAFLVEVHEAMSSRKFLLPLAGLLAIGLAIAGWSARPALADVASVQPSTTTPAVGVPMTVTVNLTNSAPGQVVTLFASGSFGQFSGGTSNTGSVTGGSAVNQPSILTFTSNATGTAGFIGNFTCISAGSVSFTASQGAPAATSQVANIVCGSTSPTTLTVSPTTATINQQVQVTGTCAAGGQDLTATSQAFGNSPAPTNGSIIAPQIVRCIAAGPITAFFYCSTAVNVTFTLGSTQGTVNCSAQQTGGGITATPPSVGVGQQATISGNCVGSQTVTSSAGGAFQAVISGAQYSSQNTLICGGGVFSAVFVCGQQPIQVTFSSGTSTGTLGCGVAATGGLSVNPASGSVTTISAQCSIPGQQLTATGTGTFAGANINGTQVPNVAGTTVVNCTSVGTLTAQFNCTTVGTANFNLAGTTGTFTCTTGTGGTCPGGGIFNPVTGGCAASGGVPSTITITANPSSLQCTGSSSVAFMSVTVKDAQGQNVQDGTNVTITADSGTFAPSQATTLGGTTQFIYSPASTSSGTVNIRANAGSAQGTGSVNVTCGGSTTTPPPSSAPVTSPPPPPTGPVTIQPPNTGDAGLATGTHSTDWQLYAAATILVAVGAGTIALVRTKA
jgi:hypothetical protein